MFDKPPSERRWLSWTYVVLFSCAIFLTVPFARAIQEYVSGSVGRAAFLIIVALAGIVAAYFAWRRIRARKSGTSAKIALGAVGAAFAIYTYELRQNPEEALHFVEYGVLGLLAYRALAHSVRDYTIYFSATLVVASVGIIDEWIQWLTPDRVWDLRDIRINVIAGLLTQVAIGAGLRPRLIAKRPRAASLAVMCVIAATTSALLGLTFVNTPERTARLATAMPSLSFLMENRNVMVEYGYLYDEPDIGIFRSRFSPEELAMLDDRRGAEVRSIVDEYISEARFREFLSAFSVTRDAYAHEAGVHLFRRNRYYARAQTEPSEAASHYNVALREQQFLERYFPATLRNSIHAWTPEIRAEVEAGADTSVRYETRVSEAVITRVTEQQMITGLSVIIVGLLALAAYFRRVARQGSGAGIL